MVFAGSPDEVVLPSCLPMPRAGCSCGVHGAEDTSSHSPCVPPVPAVQFQAVRSRSASSGPAPLCGAASVELAIVKWNFIRFLSCTFC